MAEIERMIRMVLDPGPQRGRDVVAWVCDATGYSQRTVYRTVGSMTRAGELHTGLWSVTKVCPVKLRIALEARIPMESPPSVTEALPEMIEREWRELRGEIL